MTEKSDSKCVSFVTIVILGQPPESIFQSINESEGERGSGSLLACSQGLSMDGFEEFLTGLL